MPHCQCLALSVKVQAPRTRAHLCQPSCCHLARTQSKSSGRSRRLSNSRRSQQARRSRQTAVHCSGGGVIWSVEDGPLVLVLWGGMTMYLKNFVDCAPRSRLWSPCLQFARCNGLTPTRKAPCCRRTSPRRAFASSICRLLLSREQSDSERPASHCHHSSRPGDHLQARSSCLRSCNPASRGSESWTAKQNGCRRRVPRRSRHASSSSCRCAGIEVPPSLWV